VTNRNELEMAAEERLFAASLDEVSGDCAVPRRRIAAPRTRWVAAAIVLLGLAVVAGVVVTSRSGPALALAPQEPVPLPPVVKVRGMAKLLKADRRVENLSCAIEGPDFGPLQEFVRLRALRVEQDHDLPHPTLVQSAWSLAPVARCTKLEFLSVGPLARFTTGELAPIVALPSLRSLELVGAEKNIDADFVAVLAKLPLRSLVLHAVHILPEGLRALGELPLLERLELRDCTGLEKCDLKPLYRLRQLRALALRGVGRPRVHSGGPVGPGGAGGTGVSIELPEVRDGKFVLTVTAEWVAGLAKAMPNLRELDLAECRIDDEVVAALPRALTFLGLRATLGYGESGVEAVGALPELRTLAIGDPIVWDIKIGLAPVATWLPLLPQKKLQRIEFTGVATPELITALAAQSGLRELRLDLPVRWPWDFQEGRAGRPEAEVAFPSFTPLVELRGLQSIELVGPSEALEKAIRLAVGDRVPVVILQR